MTGNCGWTHQVMAGTDPRNSFYSTWVSKSMLTIFFQMKWRLRCRHSDGVWTQTDSSSWQLPDPFFFFGFFCNAKNQREIWSVVSGQDQVRVPLQPQTTWTQTGREQSNRGETTLVQGQKHSSIEPKEKFYTFGTAIENSPYLQKCSLLAFWFWKIVNVFLSLQFGYLGGQWSPKKNSLFSVFWTGTEFLLGHPSLGKTEFVLSL